MIQTQNTQAAHPACFGELWDQTAAECTGGYDPAFVATNGSKVRPRCDFFDTCRIRVNLKKANEQQRALIAPTSLIRPRAPAPVMPYAHRFQQQPPAQQMVPQQYAQQPYPYPVVVTQPVQMMPTNYGMPAYLTTPEERQPDESIWGPLGREVFRSMGKAFGHSLARFFDVTAFTTKDE